MHTNHFRAEDGDLLWLGRGKNPPLLSPRRLAIMQQLPMESTAIGLEIGPNLIGGVLVSLQLPSSRPRPP